MTIRYRIRSNEMVGKKDEYAAQVRPAFTADIEDVVERMTQSGCALSKAAALGVLEMFFSTVERMVLDGINVTTPLVNVHASVTGTFKGEDDRFDRRRHRIEARTTPGRRLRRTVRLYGRAEREPGRGHPLPNPVFYEDLESGQKNGVLTPGGMGRVYGARLKFDPADPRQGIFFVGPDKRATRVGRGQRRRAHRPIRPPADRARGIHPGTAAGLGHLAGGRESGGAVLNPEAAYLVPKGRLPADPS